MSQSSLGGFRFREIEEDEPSAQTRRSASLYEFVRNTRTFPKTAAEIRDFSYAKLRRDDEDIVVVISLRNTQRRSIVSSRDRYGAAVLLSQSVHTRQTPRSATGWHWNTYLKTAPANLTQQLEFAEILSQKDKEDITQNDHEVTVAAGLGLLLKDSWVAIRKYTVSWMAIWGAVVQLTAWLLGGFDAELKTTIAVVALFLVTKVLLHVRAGEFGLAFWRILHFPLWMTVIAIGTLGDLSHAEDATSLRQLAMLFVTVWCLGGSTDSVMKLLGLRRVEHLRRGFKRLVREAFAEDDEDSDGSGGTS